MHGSHPVYGQETLAIEPHGIEQIQPAERHGRVRSLFGLWFGANAEIATWALGTLSVALYGTSLKGALLGLLIGNLAGCALLGYLSTYGARTGVPQMLQSRYAFGFYGNMLPAALTYLSGIGWFAINTVFGTYALVTLTHLPYAAAVGLMLAAQVVIAVYGYNAIHAFEKVASYILGASFAVLLVVTIPRTNFAAPFNAHAPLAFGGEVAGVILSAALSFSYAAGWMPFASDYSRYLPESSDPKRIWLHVFLGAAIPCVVLESMGAAAVTVIHGTALADASPTDVVLALLGSGWLAYLGLIAVTLGTLTANTLNVYSGAIGGLVVKETGRSWAAPLALAGTFAGLTGLMLRVAAAGGGAHVAGTAVAASATMVGMAVLVVARFALKRWQAALVVGALGGILSMGGSHPAETAKLYTNFLLVLSYWTAPWCAVVLFAWLTGGKESPPSRLYLKRPAFGPGFAAWLAGLVASLPFWSQAWYVGPIAARFPRIGDLSYEVGFLVASAVYLLLARTASAPEAEPSAS
ncbi:MAG TPA: cytosine permease [Candidatus Dormibacteraeota bacterium]|nr:cytosine permease [Candidatus Dormibacteraeota bacterium]